MSRNPSGRKRAMALGGGRNLALIDWMIGCRMRLNLNMEFPSAVSTFLNSVVVTVLCRSVGSNGIHGNTSSETVGTGTLL